MTASAPDLTRLSVNMNRETTELLRAFANERGLTYTEAIRRCIAITKWVQDEQAEGRAVLSVDANRRSARELVFL